jgi:hypothetical protein
LAWLTLVVARQPACAQDAPAPATPGDAGCELHVWPASGFHTTYFGWAHGGTVDGNLKGREGYQQFSTDLLSSERQVGQLRGLQIGDLLGLSNYRVVVHDQALTSREIRTGLARHATPSPPCYAELMTDDLVIQNNVLYGVSLNAIYRFRQFNGEGAPTRSYGTYILQKLEHYPPKDGEDPKLGPAELVSAYTQSVTAFGLALQRSASRAAAKK